MFIPRAIGSIVDRVARQSVGKDWGLYAALLDHWPEIVGHDYAETTTPVKMTFPHQPQEQSRRGGTLYVRLPKGLAMEFSFKSEQIRQRINSYFGCDVIAKIAFEAVYGSAPRKAAIAVADPAVAASVKETVSSVENDELRDALESFGVAMMSPRQ